MARKPKRPLCPVIQFKPSEAPVVVYEQDAEIYEFVRHLAAKEFKESQTEDDKYVYAQWKARFKDKG